MALAGGVLQPHLRPVTSQAQGGGSDASIRPSALWVKALAGTSAAVECLPERVDELLGVATVLLDQAIKESARLLIGVLLILLVDLERLELRRRHLDQVVRVVVDGVA